MRYLPSSSYSLARRKSISLEVSTLHSKTAILETTPNPDQFVSPIFDVPKKNSDNRRVILNLKVLNSFIIKIKFKLEGYNTIIGLIQRGDFLVSIDLKDAYLMFSMNPDFWKFLCFEWLNTRYFYQCMPFGLTSSPRIFTKVMKAVLVFLRSRGLRVSAWFDDIILAASSVSLLLEHLYFAKILLKSLGFLINEEKSSLIPSQTLNHLGYIWDTVSFTLSVPEDKVNSLKLKCEKALSHPVSLRFLSKILGTIEAFRTAFPFAALHYRDLQREVANEISSGSAWDLKINPSTKARKDLSWWASCQNPLPSRSLAPFLPLLTITTDSSSSGWGGFTSQNEEVSGFWTEEESQFHNNFLETKAVLLAFQSLFRETFDSSILIRSDNSTTVAYINNQGGVQSQEISELIVELYDFCIQNELKIKASFLRGRFNERADALSRRPRDHDYSLPQHFFSSICAHFNIFPTTDLFASRINFKIKNYYSEGPDPLSSGFDAFITPWPDSVYAFPPINLIQKFLSRFIQLKITTGLIIIPYWPAQAYFPILLDLLIDTPIFFPVSRLEATDNLPQHLSKCLACVISSTPEKKQAFLESLPFASSKVSRLAHSAHTVEAGKVLPIGSIHNRLITAISM